MFASNRSSTQSGRIHQKMKIKGYGPYIFWRRGDSSCVGLYGYLIWLRFEICLARWFVRSFLQKVWLEQSGQDIAEYAVLLAVILVIVVGTLRIIGLNANTIFSAAASNLN
jgi:Flp pilus assembly pilin Flp